MSVTTEWWRYIQKMWNWRTLLPWNRNVFTSKTKLAACAEAVWLFKIIHFPFIFQQVNRVCVWVYDIADSIYFCFCNVPIINIYLLLYSYHLNICWKSLAQIVSAEYTRITKQPIGQKDMAQTCYEIIIRTKIDTPKYCHLNEHFALFQMPNISRCHIFIWIIQLR